MIHIDETKITGAWLMRVRHQSLGMGDDLPTELEPISDEVAADFRAALLSIAEPEPAEHVGGDAGMIDPLTVKDPVNPIGVILVSLRRESDGWMNLAANTDDRNTQMLAGLAEKIIDGMVEAIEAETGKATGGT